MIKLLLNSFIVACSIQSALAFPNLESQEVLAKEGVGLDNPVRKIAKRGIFDRGPSYPENKQLVEERFVGLTGTVGECSVCDGQYDLYDEYDQRIVKYFYRHAVQELIKDKNPRQSPQPYLLWTHHFRYQEEQFKGLEYLHKAIAISDPRSATEVFFKFGSPFIKLYGENDRYKGEIGLDIDRERIVFFGSDKVFSSRSVDKMFDVRIINQEGQVVRDIIINGSNSMIDVMRNLNLGHGVPYEYGYIIEVFASEPTRLTVKVNDNEVKDGPFQKLESSSQKFILIDDELLSYKYYERKYLHLLLEWTENFKAWGNETNRQINKDVPSYTADQKTTWINDKLSRLRDQLHSLHQDIQIIQNSEDIHKLKIKVRKLEKKVDENFEKLKTMINNLSYKIRNPESDPKTCQQGFGIISPISSLIPGAGTIVSAVTGVIAAACTVADV